MNYHQLPDTVNITKVIKADVASIYIYKNEIIVIEVKEGVILSIKNGKKLLLKTLKAVGTNPCVLISNRINSFSINPNDYIYLEKIPTLLGIAIVYYNDTTKTTGKLESNFYKKPFKTFNNIIDAYNWSMELIKK